jgi:hypothetical protein
MLFPTNNLAASIELNQDVYFFVANKLPRLGLWLRQGTGWFGTAAPPSRVEKTDREIRPISHTPVCVLNLLGRLRSC